MPQRIIKTFRSLLDPLRNTRTAERWINALPANDAVAMQKRAVDVIGRFPHTADIRPQGVEALLKADAQLETLLAQLTRDYTSNYEKSSEIELRTWQAGFDLVKAFVAAYQSAWRAGHTRGQEKRWRAVLPWVLVRLAHYKGLDGKFRLFRFSHWTSAQWRAFHDLYDSSRNRGWHREQLVFGAAAFSRTAVSVEQKYIQTLLLMRLDSGNFTADQVEWIAAQLEDWSPTLSLTSSEGDAGFVVDLSTHQGLRRIHGADQGDRLLFLDATPVYTRVIERLRWLPQRQRHDDKSQLPIREQRLLLMRLAALFGPETLAITPRATRFAVDSEVRVVVGLQALCSAIGESESPDMRDDAAIDRQVAEIGAAIAGPDSLRHKIAGSMWRMADRSASGCRLASLAKNESVRLGDLIAMKEGATWSLAAVRRMHRHESDELTIGVEIIARRFVRVLLRAWSDAGGNGRIENQPFFAIYVPTDTENRRPPQRSLIGPEEQFIDGAMADLHTARGHYLVRLTETLERQQGWSWALFNAVRKLA